MDGALRPGESPFLRIKAGDIVVRILGGAPMELGVTDVDDKFIYCGPNRVGWKFDRLTGIEVDEEIGWGPQFGVSGSYLLPPGETEAYDTDLLHSERPQQRPLPERFRFQTATGSRYEVDNRELTWHRIIATLASGLLRSGSGRLVSQVDPVIGLRVVLVCEPFAPGLGTRLVVTTPVVTIEELAPAPRASRRRARSEAASPKRERK